MGVFGEDLEVALGPALAEQISLYDRQVRAWLRDSIKELADLYDSQAEVYREQTRRLTAPAAETPDTTDAQRLAADVQLLKEAK